MKEGNVVIIKSDSCPYTELTGTILRIIVERGKRITKYYLIDYDDLKYKERWVREEYVSPCVDLNRERKINMILNEV